MAAFRAADWAVRLFTDIDMDGRQMNLFGKFNCIRQLEGDGRYRVTDTPGGEFPAPDSTTTPVQRR